ncbi:LPD7 domain-containing protein [Pseudomonas savastanoi]|uniref:LPD7 domain-containing protein n=1 Tax=Pseudomonas savastanoi TaxID=29438 RepID=UPI00287BB23F|nr:LPD7 domain-containing protein [Pseudomonas savastanoi]
MDRFASQVDPAAASQRARDLSAKDLYTRKAKFSQNVHYLDKQTDKTLFVDTGKTISMRRTGITESGVSVALQLARERFGSTLTITGTAEFKKLVIEAVAKNGLDVHFTDKAMNQSLAARRAELDIERGGQSIGPATDLPRHVDDATRDVRDQADRMGVTVSIEALYGQGKTADQVSQALATQLDTVPEPERIAFVETVAITLGIPERGQPKGDQAFAQWQAQRAHPDVDSAATASAETPTPVPTPSDAAPEPVSPEAQKPRSLLRPTTRTCRAPASWSGLKRNGVVISRCPKRMSGPRIRSWACEVKTMPSGSLRRMTRPRKRLPC